jgi:acid phosphatase
MFPVLRGVIDLLLAGPGVATKTPGGQSMPLPSLIAAFTHDNQINELASLVGVFDGQKPLPANRIDSNRVSISSL